MPKLLVIDTETGGTDPYAHSLLSLGAVVWDDGSKGAEIELLVGEPTFSVTAEAMKINRIDLVCHGAAALPPALATSELERFIAAQFAAAPGKREKVTLAGHNVGFDIGFLKRLYRMAGSDFDETYSHRSLDTAAIVRFLSLAGVLPLASAGSDAAFEYFGIEVPEGKRHTALGDALATATLLTRLVELVQTHGGSAHPLPVAS